MQRGKRVESQRAAKRIKSSTRFEQDADTFRSSVLDDDMEHGSAKAALRSKCGCAACTRRRAKMRRRGLLV